MAKDKFLKPRILPKSSEKYGCFHLSIYVVEDTRLLECQTCGKTLDPFEWLMQRAVENKRNDMVTRGLAGERRKLSEEVEELKRQKRNLQAQVRRLSKKAGGGNESA